MIATALGELYDEHGITGNERPFFDLARSLWDFMPAAERAIPDMLCTFFAAGCKYNQLDFVHWVLPMVEQLAATNVVSLTQVSRVNRLFYL
jgi:hypothetical protein